jgi:hypothetical protein
MHRNNFTATFSLLLVLTIFIQFFYYFASSSLSLCSFPSTFRLPFSRFGQGRILFNFTDSEFMNYLLPASAKERGHQEPILRRFLLAGSRRHRYDAFPSATVSKTWDSSGRPRFAKRRIVKYIVAASSYLS